MYTVPASTVYITSIVTFDSIRNAIVGHGEETLVCQERRRREIGHSIRISIRSDVRERIEL